MNFEIKNIANRFTEITFEEDISDSLLNNKLTLIELIESEYSDKIQDLRAGFKSICIQWKDSSELKEVEELLQDFKPKDRLNQSKTWLIPVCYDISCGFDISSLAKAKGLSVQEIIDLHCSQTYRLHFYGFLPGFMYLSGLDSKLAYGRKKVPDRSVPSGSVAIGGDQTGIYPGESPGGWHVIGKTPISFFDAKSKEPVWASAGDSVRFNAISLSEFENLSLIKTEPKSF